MNDLVERLRAMARSKHHDLTVPEEAADEIERLRAERDGALRLAKRHMDEKHRTQRQAAEDWDVLQQRTKTAEVERDRLREALRLADAALSGANMNMRAVEKKVRAALGESDATAYATVPKEPTQGMLDAGEAAYFRKITDMASVTPTEHHAAGGGPMGYAYRAMLAAAKETGHE